MSDLTIDLQNNSMQIHRERAEPWKITLVDTGDDSMTGGRLLRVADHLQGEKAFCFTYGDGVGNNNITESINFHYQHGKLATMTTSYRPGRFGAIAIRDNKVLSFTEKPKGDGGMVNAGFFVLSPKVFDLIDGDDSSWEQEPLQNLSSSGELMAFQHLGFWQPMDNLHDKHTLENLWSRGVAPWKIW